MKIFGKRKRMEGWRSLTIDAQTCRVAHVQRKGDKPVVRLAEEFALEGKVPDLLARLSRQWQDQQYALTTCVEAGAYQLLPVEAPKVPKNELKSAVFWLIRDMVDFPMESAVVDAINIPSHDEGRKPMMYAVVAQSAQVRTIQERFEVAKLPLAAIDIPEMAQRNIAALAEQPNRALALVSFGRQGALLTITAGGELYLARRFDVSDAELANASDFDREHLHERIALEVQRSLDHFRRQFASLPISRLLLAPCEFALDELASYLNQNLDLGTEPFDLATAFDFAPAPQLQAQAEQARYFTTLGLGLRVEQTTL